MLLNANNLKLVDLASTDESRYNVAGLYVCALATVATDGHVLGAVATPTDDPADFPQVLNGNGGAWWEKELPPAILPRQACQDALKAIPKKPRQPVLGNALLTGDTIGSARCLVTTDLDTTKVTETKAVHAEFPDWQACVPGGQPTLTVAYNPALLAKVLGLAAKMGLKAVKLEFYDDVGPVKITGHILDTGQDVLFLVMPCRL